jgi:hypothetical protein
LRDEVPTLKRVATVLTAAVCLLGVPVRAVAAESVQSSIARVPTNTPVFPFGQNGLCPQSCPNLGSGAVVNYLSISVVGQSASGPRVSLNAGDTILMLYVGIDNGGYSNWWTATGALVSDTTGARANLGKAAVDDGSEYPNLRISCGRRYLNDCSPSITWSAVRLDPTFSPGSYSLEITFTPIQGLGLSAVTHLLGPAIVTVNPSAASPQQRPGLAGKSCQRPGQVRKQNGVQFGCVRQGSKNVWTRLG